MWGVYVDDTEIAPTRPHHACPKKSRFHLTYYLFFTIEHTLLNLFLCKLNINEIYNEMTLNILLLMAIIKAKLYVERQSCSSCAGTATLLDATGLRDAAVQ